MRRRLAIAAIGAAVTLTLAVGIAYATIPGPDNIYSACMLKGIGTIRLIDKSLPATNLMSRCTDKELEVSWSQRGPQGDPGAAGAKGDKGDPGNLALANRSCGSGDSVAGFDASGDLVCRAAGGGGLELSQLSLGFPPTPVGSSAPFVPIALTNTGAVDLNVPFRFSSDNFDFAVVFLPDGCAVSNLGGVTVPAQATCTLSVRFAPSGAGARTATLTILRPSDSVSIPLSGLGLG